MAKISAIVVCSLLCLVLGAAAGAVATAYFGPQLTGVNMVVKFERGGRSDSGNASMPGKGGPMGKGGGKGGKGGGMADMMAMMKGGKGGGGPGGGNMMAMMMKGKGKGQPPSPTRQLENLVVKLDLLTDAPLKLTLTKEQKKEIAEHVRELSKEEKLTDEEAQKHLDALLKILDSQKSVLTAAGYRWPGAMPQDNENVQEHAAALEKRLKEQGK